MTSSPDNPIMKDLLNEDKLKKAMAQSIQDQKKLSPDNTVENSLKRLLADVDDHMEFVGTVWQTKANASKQISRAIQKTKKSLDSHYRKKHYKEFLDIIGADEGVLDMPNLKDYMHKDMLKAIKYRNALRAELRTALQDRLGEKSK